MKPSHLAIFTVALSTSLPAFAASVDVTGNPSLGGWTNGGSSLADGVFVQGANGNGANNNKRYDFTIYYSSFTVTAGSPLLASTAFQVGDTAIGLGAVVNGVWDSAGVFHNTVADNALSQLNGKFGTNTPNGSIPLYAPAVPGPAAGSDSAGNGGLGSFLLTVGSQLSGSGIQNVRPDRSTTYDGTAHTIGTSSDTNFVGVFIGDSSAGNLQSFEFFISNGALSRQSFTPIPIGAGSIVTMQNVSNTSLFTDAYINSNSPAAVPLPPALWTGLTLLTGLSLLSLRRKLTSH